MRVRYYGHVGTPTGYGIAGAEMCMAMLEAGIELDILPTGNRLEAKYAPLLASIKDEVDAHPDPDAVIVHTLPMDCWKVIERAGIPRDGWSDKGGRLVKDGRKVIAYTTWEGHGPAPTSIICALRPFAQIGQIWVPSTAALRSLEEAVWPDYTCRTSVRVVPHACDTDPLAYPNPVDAVKSGPPYETYRFYYIGAWNVRKNPEGVIRAYLRAFTRDDDVELVIHSAGAPPSAVSLAVLAATGGPMDEEARIVFSNQELVSEGIRALHMRSDCFVSASRGEAWNIPAFDAMMHRNHIIVPECQGTGEFLDGTSASYVTTSITPAAGECRLHYESTGECRAFYMGSQGLDVRSSWGDPNLIEMAHMMRKAYEHRPRLEVRYDPAKRFGRAAVGKMIRDLIEGKQ